MDTDGIIAGGGCLIAENGYVQKESYFQKPETERIQEYLLTRELPFAMESQERIFMNRAAAVLLRQDFIGKLKGLGAEEIRKREKENSIPYEDTLKEYMHSPDPVSYTHLDVYKRQDWRSRKQKKPWDLGKSCLIR